MENRMVPYGTIWYHNGTIMVPYGTIWYHNGSILVPFGTIRTKMFHFSMFQFPFFPTFENLLFFRFPFFQNSKIFNVFYLFTIFYIKKLPINHLWWLLVGKINHLLPGPGKKHENFALPLEDQLRALSPISTCVFLPFIFF